MLPPQRGGGGFFRRTFWLPSPSDRGERSELGFGGEGLGSLLTFWLPSPSDRGERERVRIWGRGAGGEGAGSGDVAQRLDASFGDTLNGPRSGRPKAAPKRYPERSVLPDGSPPHPQPLSPKQAGSAAMPTAFENETRGLIARLRKRGLFGGEGSQKVGAGRRVEERLMMLPPQRGGGVG